MAGSVSRARGSWSWGHAFESYVVRRDYFKKLKKIKWIFKQVIYSYGPPRENKKNAMKSPSHLFLSLINTLDHPFTWVTIAVSFLCSSQEFIHVQININMSPICIDKGYFAHCFVLCFFSPLCISCISQNRLQKSSLYFSSLTTTVACSTFYWMNVLYLIKLVSRRWIFKLFPNFCCYKE